MVPYNNASDTLEKGNLTRLFFFFCEIFSIGFVCFVGFDFHHLLNDIFEMNFLISHQQTTIPQCDSITKEWYRLST